MVSVLECQERHLSIKCVIRRIIKGSLVAQWVERQTETEKVTALFRVNIKQPPCYLLDTLHSRARLHLITNDDGTKFCHGLVPRLREVHVFIRLRELWLCWNSLLLLGVSGWSAGPVVRHAVFFQGQGGLSKGGKTTIHANM